MIYFFDTSALQYRYINGAKSRGIRKTISDKRNSCFISTLTILEIAGAFAKYCRKNSLTKLEYRKLDKLFWADVEIGSLQVIEPRQQEYLKALHLIEHAGVVKKRNLSSSDALIAATCLGLALDKESAVKFCLEDWTLYDSVRQLPAYSSVMDFRFIGEVRGA